MKIAIMSTFPPEKCGVGIYSNNLFKSLIENKGIQIVKIGTPESKSDYNIGFKSLNLLDKINSIIKKENIDVIHLQYNAPHFGRLTLNYGFIRFLKKVKIPVVVTLHEVQYPQKLNLLNKLRLKIIKHIEKNIVKNASKIIVHTPKQRDFLKKTYSAKNIECVYHGLELLPEKKSPKKQDILFFGIVTPAKGINYLIKAMTHLKNYNLTIAGDTPSNLKDYKEELTDLIKKNKLKNIKTNFRWMTDDEKWKYYQKADLVVLPYTWAPYQSGVLHNAISAGLPVVVTKVGALNEIVDEFKIGEVVQPKNPRSIAKGIEKAFNNYSRYRQGIKNYRKEANWKNVGKKHMEVYKKSIKERSKNSR